MPFKKKKGTVSPVNILREYVSTYMYWVKTGKEKFRHKKEIGPIFAEMESARYLFEQALSGTVYDYQKKLERNVWAAAMHKYGEEMDKLKDALQRAVEDCEAAKSDEEKEAAARAKEEAEKRKQEEEKLSLKEQMALAEQRELEEEEDEQGLFHTDCGWRVTGLRAGGSGRHRSGAGPGGIRGSRTAARRAGDGKSGG